ncbi:MAG TPA: hypothetical protein VE665_07780 [Hyphomicrobiaceae bacterium]|jgi:hypothetical protein|nr:hypothetical protein [Hyphomicrobiaceae bacterium]
MNWRIGLFWTWVMLTWVWVAAIVLIMAQPHPHAPFAAIPVSWIAALGLGPPALLFGLGLVGLWIASGLRRNP